jgi:RimJ/RimL family protein N-acetyltransferase
LSDEPLTHDLAPIRCDRLTLELFSLASIEALLAGRIDEAERLLDVRFSADEWLPAAEHMLRYRKADLLRDPTAAPWLARVMVLPDREAVGYIGFHGSPDSGGMVELGYTVFAAQRRKAYALEAARGMMGWARKTHAARTFRVTVAPDNRPSLAMAAKLGFVHVGEQMDEIDGLELVFEQPVS